MNNSSMNVSNNSNEPIEWETRPSGMLVQRRDGDGDSDNHQVEDAAAASSSLVLNIKINVAHGPSTGCEESDYGAIGIGAAAAKDFVQRKIEGG
ncbi:hypothetical protein Q3G72_005082 [Acer saccharum]|nr:hypothetical protein Q3G72_005082 [Acer saccharum]